MINFKQKEVLNKIVGTLQEKFPEVRLVSVEDLGANSFWVTMLEPAEEERQDAFDDLQAELATDALIDYGFQFRFVPASSRELAYTEKQHLQAA